MTPVGLDPQPHYCNYYLGNDPRNWKSGIHPCTRIYYKDVWPGIDAEVLGSDKNFKYQFRVAPGADPSLIQLQLQGIDNPGVENEQLIIGTSIGEFKEEPPYCFQVQNGKLQPITGKFVLMDSVISFDIDTYDPNCELVIDPELVAATFVGSTGGIDELWGQNSTYDAAGNIYLISGPSAPILPASFGAFSTVFSGEIADLGISKFNPTGSQLLWATYVGGSSHELCANAQCNAQNQLVLTGTSNSTDFPITENAFDPEKDNSLSIDAYDVFISTLSEDGTTLYASTFFGSPMSDGYSGFAPNVNGTINPENRFGLDIDPQGNVVIGTATGYLTYPGVNYVLGGLYYAQHNMAVACFSPDLSQMLWCTLIGSPDFEDINDIVILGDGNIAICGGTSHALLPVTTGTYQTIHAGGGYDGWLGIVDGLNGTLLRSTFFGTSGNDDFDMIDVGPDGSLWITGGSNGNLPQTPGVYSSPASWRFIANFSADLNNLLLCSRIGGNTEEEKLLNFRAFMIDDCGRVYIGGHGMFEWIDSIELTPDAIATAGGSFVSVWNPNMVSLAYATLYMGNHSDVGKCHFDKHGVVYQAVCSHANFDGNPFQALPGAYDQSQSPSFEAAVFKIDLDAQSVVSSFSYVPITSCIPYEVQFSNWSDPAAYQWNFDDGPGWQEIDDSSFNHTFFEPGPHLIQLVAHDINSCNVWDTMKVIINVPASESLLDAAWEYPPFDNCLSAIELPISFVGAGADSLLWQLPDGDQIINQSSVSAQLAAPGLYNIALIAFDNTCNISDTLSLEINLGPPVSADILIEEDPQGCQPELLIAQAATSNGENFEWTLNGLPVGDSESFSQEFHESGEYNLALVASGLIGCARTDTAFFSFTVFALPQVALDLPDTLCAGAGTYYLNAGNPEGGNYSGDIVTENTIVLSNAAPGTYPISYSFTDENGCSAVASDSLVVAICTHMAENESQDMMHIFPNPATQWITFDCIVPFKQMKIWDERGALVFVSSHHQPVVSLRVDVSTFAAGIYHFEAFTASSRIAGNVIVQK